MRLLQHIWALAGLTFLAFSDGTRAGKTESHKEAAHVREYFYVGGEYVDTADGHMFHNQMYVERLTPSSGSTQPYPLVLVHGGGQTGTNFLNKPDGGQGWASWFLSHGYTVYLLDRTYTARSPLLPSDNFTSESFSAEFIAQRFTAVQKYPKWPQAKLHTQWPGTGEMGDPIFNTYYSSTTQSITASTTQEQTMKAAGEALLDTIGPSIIITHSQGGLYGWSWADSQPSKIKALVQIEPKGPPFHEVIFSDSFSRPWGLTSIPLTYDPMPSSSSPAANQSTTTKQQQQQQQHPLSTKTVPADSDDLLPCMIQAEPARKLPNLARVPILIETGEASYHAQYDYCIVKFLRQAGVQAEHLELGKVGIRGNAHLQFMERNSDEIARALHGWIVKTVGGEA